MYHGECQHKLKMPPDSGNYQGATAGAATQIKYIVAHFPAEREEFLMDNGKIFEKLIHLAAKNGIKVLFAPLPGYYARISGERIAISQEKLDTIEDYNYNLAHELSHYFLHYDKGNIRDCDKTAEYEEQADRAARMLLEALAVTAGSAV